MNNIIKNFIVFEGLDGAGTTTQVELLSQFLKAKSKNVFTTFEPTNNETGLFLRKCLAGEIKLHPITMLMLFVADRNEHIFGKNGILKAFDKNDFVICDRYFFSTLAYQGVSTDYNLAKKYNETFPLPEILFFLDIEPKTALYRIKSRDRELEIYEKIDFQTKVQNMYKKVLFEYKDTGMNIVKINADQSVKKIHSKVIDTIKDKLTPLI